MGGKYPTPSEAVSHYIEGIELNVEKYEKHAKTIGARKLGEWFNKALPEIYRTVAGLPAKRGTIRTRILERAVPVAEKVSALAEEYRKGKVAALASAVASPA